MLMPQAYNLLFIQTYSVRVWWRFSKYTCVNNATSIYVEISNKGKKSQINLSEGTSISGQNP